MFILEIKLYILCEAKKYVLSLLDKKQIILSMQWYLKAEQSLKTRFRLTNLTFVFQILFLSGTIFSIMFRVDTVDSCVLFRTALYYLQQKNRSFVISHIKDTEFVHESALK